MAYSALYFDEVINDINKTKLWYKEKKDGLEIEFALAIEQAIRLIMDRPTVIQFAIKMFVLHTLKYSLIIFIFTLMNLSKLL